MITDISSVEKPSISPRRPSSVPCRPLPIINMNMPMKSAQELPRTCIMTLPFLPSASPG